MFYFEYFIVKKLAFNRSPSFSKYIIYLAMLSIMLSVSTIITAGALVHGFKKEVAKKVFGFSAHIQVLRHSLNNAPNQKPIYKYQTFYNQKDKIKGIKHVQAVIEKPAIVTSQKESEGLISKGIGSDFNWHFFKQYLIQGDTIDVLQPHYSKNVVISSLVAKKLQVKLHDKLIFHFIDKQQIRTRALKVKGIYETGLEDFDEKFILMDIRLIQKINNWGQDSIGFFEVFVDDISNIDNINKQLYYNIANYELISYPINQLAPGIFVWLDLLNNNLSAILFLMILVAIINMVASLLILILERTNMIGILKSVGADNLGIRKIFLLHALYIILIGVIAGNALGLAVCLAQKHIGFISLPQDSYYLSQAPIYINGWFVFIVNLGVICINILALILPTLFINRIHPINAIKFK